MARPSSAGIVEAIKQVIARFSLALENPQTKKVIPFARSLTSFVFLRLSAFLSLSFAVRSPAGERVRNNRTVPISSAAGGKRALRHRRRP